MAKKRVMKTKPVEIVAYWSTQIDECDLPVDWADALTHCWRCGCPAKLERCHLVPHALGGEDAASNFVLLCSCCHKEAPNVHSADFMWRWIKEARRLSFGMYEVYWWARATEECKRLYADELDIDLSNATVVQAVEIFRAVFPRTSTHFGQGHLNTSTMA